MSTTLASLAYHNPRHLAYRLLHKSAIQSTNPQSSPDPRSHSHVDSRLPWINPIPRPRSRYLLRRLLRRLLREATHLPDPAAQSYLHRHILGRFRTYNQENVHEWLAKLPDERKHEVMDRLVAAEENARKSLSVLCAANAGYARPLEKVLFYTYGRKGKRRRELLEDLKGRSEPTAESKGEAGAASGAEEQPIDANDSVPVQSAQDFLRQSPLPHDPVATAILQHPTPLPLGLLHTIPRLSSAKTALLHSQRILRASEHARGPLPSALRPPIPAENMWKQPMPVRRIKNIIIKWYANLMDKLLPPLEEPEWLRLQQLAQGTLVFGGWDSKGRGVLVRKDENRDDLRQSRQSDLSSSEHSALERVLGISPPDPLEMRNKGAHRPHRITPRYMQRLWRRVFETCPCMRWNEDVKRWNVKWGTTRRNRTVVQGSPKEKKGQTSTKSAERAVRERRQTT